MSNPAIEEFAELLMRQVRDQAVKSCDGQLTSQVQSPVAKRWREAAAANPGASALGRVMVPDCVDETIFALLQAIDQGVISLSFKSKNGTVVDLSEDGLGELSGWFMGSGGWRATYSKERHVDDFADLASD